MKISFSLLLLCFSFISFAQMDARIGVEVVYPTGPGTSDISLNASFIGTYSGQYQMYYSDISQTLNVGSSVSGLDSATFLNTGPYFFLAIDTQSNDTVAYTSVQLLPISSMANEYGQTDSLVFTDSLISPIYSYDCNGQFTYSEIFNTGTTDYYWRSDPSSQQWVLAASSSTPPIYNLCAGQYKAFGTSNGIIICNEMFYLYPQILPNPAFQVGVTSTPSDGGFCTGTATASVNGATGPLNYYWNGVQGSITDINLCPGIHNLKVIDSNQDSVTTVFGIADSSNYFSYYNTANPADTIYVMVENCSYNYNIPTDSITLNSIQGVGQNTVLVEFALWQGGVSTTMTDTAQVNLTGAPAWFIDITVFCYTKVVGSNVIKSVHTVDKTELGIHENPASAILIYPNPANERVNIIGSFEKIELYNTLGKLMLTSTQNEIDISDFPAGLYQVVIRTDGEDAPIIKKLIIE